MSAHKGVFPEAHFDSDLFLSKEWPFSEYSFAFCSLCTCKAVYRNGLTKVDDSDF